MENTSNSVVRCLVDVVGDIDVVVSPGSRCAPLAIAFNRRERGNTLVVVDERSAAFFALGIVQKCRRPVAVVCTSGTALLNYAPAVAEAYYQRLPLVVISADRPEEWIDQDDSQTIRQNGVFCNFIKASYNIPSGTSLWHVNRIVNEAMLTCFSGRKGPVHINVPISEPLYATEDVGVSAERIVYSKEPEVSFDASAVAKKISSAGRVMMVVGFHKPDDKFSTAFLLFAGMMNNVVVVAEPLSNIQSRAAFKGDFSPVINCVENVFSSISEAEAENYAPDLVISFGGALVSKSLKAFLRKHPPKLHWYVGEDEPVIDVFKSLTLKINISCVDFVSEICSYLLSKEDLQKEKYVQMGGYQNLFAVRQYEHLQRVSGWSVYDVWEEMGIFKEIFNAIPDNSDLHLSNGLSVRLGQMFMTDKNIKYFANRGTSGIDGSTSTAAGYAWRSSISSDKQRVVTLITGDLSFLYDSNALWNNYLSSNLKIIVVNNNGGGIFRRLEGATDLSEFEKFFQAPHNVDVENLVRAFGVEYLRAFDADTLVRSLSDLYSSNDGCKVLEIIV